MSKVMFIPISVLGGLAAGFAGKKIFEQVWGMVDSEEPPDPKHRETSWAKLVAALVLEGAIFRATRGAFDHGARRAFAKFTGEWPGEERPEQE